MRRAIRLLVTAGLALAFAGVPTVVLAQEEGKERGNTAEVTCEETPADPCKAIEPGAASMEPQQALEDPARVEASKAHEKWLEEIWNSP